MLATNPGTAITMSTIGFCSYSCSIANFTSSIGRAGVHAVIAAATELMSTRGWPGVLATTGAPSAVADPLAVCNSDVIDGVEVDY